VQVQKLYPKWIPYPSSWLRALLLILVLGPVGSLMATLGLWGSLLAVFAGSTGSIALPAVYAGLASGVAVLFIPTLILAYVYHIFTLIFDATSLSKNHPRQFPTWSSWREGLLGVIIMGVSISIAFAVLFWYHPYLLTDRHWVESYFWEDRSSRIPIRFLLTKEEQEEIVAFWATIWLGSSAYLYQWDYLVRQKRDRQQKRQKALTENFSQAKKTVKSEVDPVDIELNKLRGEMGLHKMKTYPARKSRKQ
jgi:hypothetical protein